MIATPPIELEGVAAAPGRGEDLATLAVRAAHAACEGVDAPKAVVAATFSNPERFPALAVRVASELGLPAATPAMDLQMACSAYPYALYVAGRLAADLGGRVLVVDGDVQSPLVDPSDHATGAIFSDAATATLLTARPADAGEPARFDFLTRYDRALVCPAAGPIAMDGFKVFTFVATEVSAFLKRFLAEAGAIDLFVPHQANPYMNRQLARSLQLEDRTLALTEARKNPGSASVAFALAEASAAGDARLGGARVALAGFGAGLSAGVARVRLAATFRGRTVP